MKVTVSADTGSLTVTAPDEVLNRVATFITVYDWPGKIVVDANPSI